MAWPVPTHSTTMVLRCLLLSFLVAEARDSASCDDVCVFASNVTGFDGTEEAMELLQARATRKSLLLTLLEPPTDSSARRTHAAAIHEFTGTRMFINFLGLVMVACFLGFSIEWLMQGKVSRTLGAYLLIAACLTTATYTVAKPILLNELTKHQGQASDSNLLTSGSFQACPFALYLVGVWVARHLTAPLNYDLCLRYIRTAYASFCLVTLSCALTIAGGLCSWLFVALWASYGIFDPISQILRVVIVKTSAPSELGYLLAAVYGAGALGCSVGPLVNSFTSVYFEGHDVQVKTCAPLVILSILWAFPTIALSLGLPCSEQDELACMQSQDAESSYVGEESSDLTSARRTVFGLSLLYTNACTILVSSLQAGTSFVLELEMSCGNETIGSLMGSAFGLSAPLIIIFVCMLPAEAKLPHAATVLPVLASVCLFKLMIAFVGLDRYRLFIMLLADIVLFAACHAGNAIVDSVALQHALPRTMYSHENYIFTAATIRAGGFFLGPPLARTLTGAIGQDGSAAIQLFFTLLSVSCFRAMQSARTNASVDESPTKMPVHDIQAMAMHSRY